MAYEEHFSISARCNADAIDITVSRCKHFVTGPRVRTDIDSPVEVIRSVFRKRGCDFHAGVCWPDVIAEVGAYRVSSQCSRTCVWYHMGWDKDQRHDKRGACN